MVSAGGTAADHVARGASPALDLAPPRRSGRGEPIYAGRAGGVSYETTTGDWQYSAWGRYVRIDHGDGQETGYAHCETVLVTPGDHVEAGQVIATAGDSGQAAGVHLHLEVWRDRARVDPAPWMEGAA